MGYSRDTFYRFKTLYEQGGEAALHELSSKKPIIKNRVSPEIEQAVIDLAIANPALGQLRASHALKQKGMLVSSSGVRSIWLRNDLETMGKRLKALEAKSAQDGVLLTESQLAALEQVKERKVAHGEIESEHPGYLGSQDTYYVGNMKGVGKIYQQTFVDTYSRVAQVKLYEAKSALTAAEMLNDKVLPFYEKQGIDLLHILTDRGTEYCGKPENHAYQLYIGIENIDHTKTKVRSPQTNGICERFHRTMKQEFYDIAFRKRLYRSLEELQMEVDLWINKYNTQRPHAGKYCYGKTPMQTFLDAKHIALEKVIPSDNMEWQMTDNHDLSYSNTTVR